MFYFRCWGIYAFTYVPYSTVEVMHLLLYSFMCFSYSQAVSMFFLDLLGFLNRSVFSLSLEISIGVS